MGLVEDIAAGLGPETKTIETAINFVFLTKDAAYKLKKPVKIDGLIDYSTLEARREATHNEVTLNQELCAELYDSIIEAGDVADSAQGELLLKMKLLPQGVELSDQIRAGNVTTDHIDELVERLVEFHKTTPVDTTWGALENVKQIWADHESAMGATRDHADIYEWGKQFMADNADLFDKRVREGKSKECHGDFHSGNVFLYDGRLWIFDRLDIEHLRCSDVASEVAFMAMDLDFNGRHDLSTHFVDGYVAKTGDEELKKVLPFYLCHRAYVRGKIATWSNEVEKATKYFELARSYTK